MKPIALTFAVAIAAAIATLSPTPSFAQQSPRRVKKVSTTLNTSAKFNRISKLFNDHVKKQDQEFFRFRNALNEELFRRFKTVDTVAFVEAIMSIDAMSYTAGKAADQLLGLEGSDAFTSPKKIRDFLKRQFATHVLDLNQLERVITSHIGKLNDALILLDNELIVACGVDSSFDPAKLGLSKVNMSGVRSEFEDSVPALEKILDTAFGANIVTGAAGFATNMGVSQTVSDMFRDENGNETWGGMLLGIFAGEAAEYAQNQLAEELLKTKKTFVKDTGIIANQILKNLVLLEGGKESNCWSKVMAAQTIRHAVACSQLLEKEFGFTSKSLINAYK